MRTSSVAVLVVLFAAALAAAKTLDVYVIDAEGGKATLVVTPSGQSMVVDAGYAGFINEKSQVIQPNDLEADRIIRVVKLAKVKQIDYLVVSHFHNDHAENIPKLVAKLGIPVRHFVDHGPPQQQDPLTQNLYKTYLDSIGGAQRITVKPGDMIPLNGVQVEVLTSAGETIRSPLPGAGAPNDLCGAPPTRPDRGENPASVGLLYTFGKFRMIDLADLTKGKEYELMCPNNLVGAVDLYMVSHHGWDLSNSALLVHALHPQVAVMSNGAKKGNMPAVVKVLRSSPGLKDVWQIHYSVDGGKENNTSPDLIANPQEQPDPRSFGFVLNDNANFIKISAREDGTFTVTNSRNGVSKTYKHGD
jgi:beta-lactamase superfamily II metal-dependent hydrolase